MCDQDQLCGTGDPCARTGMHDNLFNTLLDAETKGLSYDVQSAHESSSAEDAYESGQVAGELFIPAVQYALLELPLRQGVSYRDIERRLADILSLFEEPPVSGA
jgi:hypothetical protein